MLAFTVVGCNNGPSTGFTTIKSKPCICANSVSVLDRQPTKGSRSR
jgi:hypothetical protein